MPTWLSPAQAAERLGVKPATLYAYVSRGQLRRRAAPDGRRSEYHAEDVAALAVRGRRARPTRPSDIIVPTAITRIGEDGPSYRGHPAVDLAGVRSFESAAALLWDTPEHLWSAPPALIQFARTATRHLGDDAGPADRLLPAVAALRSHDPLRTDTRSEVVAATAGRIIATLTSVMDDGATSVEVPGEGSVAARVAHAVAPAADARTVLLVDAALVLLADHELAASTLAVRIAASARCDPYAAVLAGLAVLSGRRHGAASRPLELTMADVAAGVAPESALERQLRGDNVPGFGHPLYPNGDPRAAKLLELIEDTPSLASRPFRAILDVGRSRGLPPPNVDLALAALSHVIGAPPGTGELLFAVARIAGWVAHLLEQYAEPTLLRPNAVYVG